MLTLPAISVSDDAVTIELVAEIENPFISAIEVVPPKPKDPNTFQPIFINCGGKYMECFVRFEIKRAKDLTIFFHSTGDEYLDNAGVRTWKADQFYTDGFTYSNTQHDILGTLDDPIYHAERWGQFSYEIPVPTGQYEITLHLVEMYGLFNQKDVHFLSINTSLTVVPTFADVDTFKIQVAVSLI